MTEESTPENRRASTVGRRMAPVLIVFCLSVAGSNLILGNLVDGYFAEDWFETLMLSVTGAFAVEILFATLVFSLTFHRWQQSLLAASCFGMVFYLAAMVGLDDFVETLSGFFLVPWIAFVIALPPLLFRLFRGWRLVDPTAEPPSQHPVALSSYFLAIAVVASLLTISRGFPVVLEIEEAEEFWLTLIITTGVLFTGSLVLTPAVTKIGLGCHSTARAVLGLALLPPIAFALVWGISQLFYDDQASLQNRLESTEPTLLAVGTGTIVLYPFLLALRWRGVRLGRAVRTAPSPSLLPTTVRGRILRGTLRHWASAVFILTAVSVNVGLARLTAWRVATDAENERLRVLAESLGGGLHWNDRVVSVLSLGEETRDEDLQAFVGQSRLQHFAITSSHVTDRILNDIVKFSHLTSLSLECPGITDAQLGLLNGLPELEQLDLENCAVTGDGIGKLSSELLIWQLQLSGTQVGDESIEGLNQLPKVRYLSLSRTPVTDAGLRKLRHSFEGLALGKSQIRGSSLSLFSSLVSLDMTQTPIGDREVAALAPLRSLYRLVLAETSVTDAAAPALLELTSLADLDLSHTDWTDQGITQLQQLPALTSLDLKGVPITGECFRGWPTGRLERLYLDETQLSDAGLKHVARLAISSVDVGHTPITAAGLLNAGWTAPGEIYCHPGQFTEAEMQQFKTLTVDVQPREADDEP